jgi:hypothetical protein
VHASKAVSVSRVLCAGNRSTTHSRKPPWGLGAGINHMPFGVVVSVAVSSEVWVWMRFSRLTNKCTAPGTPLPRHLVHDVPHTAERQQRILISPSPFLSPPIHLVHYIINLLFRSRNSLWLSDKEPSQLYPADHRFAQPTPRHALQTSSRLRERLFATEPSIAPPSHSSSPNHSQWLRNSYVCPLRMPARCVAYQTACCATTSRPDEAAQINPC